MSKRKKIILLILFLAIVVFLFNQLWFGTVKNAFFTIFSPVNKFLLNTSQNLVNWVGVVFRIQDVRQENTELKKQNLYLLQKLVSLKDIEEENGKLRKALELGLEKQYQLEVADVVSQINNGDFCLVSAGQDKNIQEGMSVISFEGVLLGKVSKVFADFSQVSMITSQSFAFEVEVQNEEPVLGMAKGKGSFELELQLVPKDQEIKDGDVVITTNLAGNFSKGILVGEIYDINRSDVQPFQSAKIHPYFRDFVLDSVLIIKDFKVNQPIVD